LAIWAQLFANQANPGKALSDLEAFANQGKEAKALSFLEHIANQANERSAVADLELFANSGEAAISCDRFGGNNCSHLALVGTIFVPV